MQVCKIVDATDVSEYAWNRLSQYYNVDFVAERICRRHGLHEGQKGNARKQAEQIRYCLAQAREYYNASKAVSLSTKPVLLYYCCMSLALAEVLYKQTAQSRLSELRAKHNCHGLQLVMNRAPDPKELLSVSSSLLMAKPQINSSGPNGTFEVWRRSAREYPIVGRFEVNHAVGGSHGYRTILVPQDIPPPPLPTGGVSLYEAASSLPYMSDVLTEWGGRLEMVSATVTHAADSQMKNTISLIVHPRENDIIDRFNESLAFSANAVNDLEMLEYPSGYVLRWDWDQVGVVLPPSMNVTPDQVYFFCNSLNLNEFGYVYVSLHILGNFARYYPDLWVKHIELNSPLASLAETLCSCAMSRLPLLTLSELSECYHVLRK